MRIERIHLPLIRCTHGAAGAIDDVFGVEVFLALELGEFAETGLENTLHRTGVVTVIDGAVEQAVEIAARPKITLEGLGLGARLAH